jgi:hypothetical protein
MTARVLVLCVGVLIAAPAFGQEAVPSLPFESVPDFPKLPAGLNFGEVPGVAVNSRGHVFVFTRSNSAHGPAFGPAASQLLEFGPKANSSARSAPACTAGRSLIRCASTETTTSGPSTRAPT